MAFCEIKVFNPLAKRFRQTEKKKQYNERIIQVDHGKFTPLVFSASVGMSRECNKLYNRLADLISGKRKENYAVFLKEEKIYYKMVYYTSHLS